MSGDEIEILLVEDSPGDVELVREGLRRGKVVNRVHVVEDGVEAMAYLRRESTYSRCPRPDLVLLDINLPRMNGHEVLEEIRTSADLSTLPVIVLTTSDQNVDVMRAYEHHANAYVTKPLKGSEFVNAVRQIEEFWVSVVTLPPRQ